MTRHVVNTFNANHPIGTSVRFWTGDRVGDGRLSKTRSAATLLGGHTAVVWVEGEPSCIALTHVQVVGSKVAPTPEPLIFGTYYRKRDGAQITVGNVDRDGRAYRWVTYKFATGRTYRVSLVAFWKKFSETPAVQS